MSNLKNLVAKANSGLSLHSKKSKNSFGLGSFIAASTEKMLLIRGGDGSAGQGLPSFGGDSVAGMVAAAWNATPDGTRSSFNYTVGSSNDYHIITNSTGNTSTSRIPGYFNIAVKKFSEWVTPDNIIGLGGRLIGFLFTTGETGKGSAKTDNPNYKGE